MANSLWVIHPALPNGADRADMDRDLGFVGDPRTATEDAIIAFKAWLPISFAGVNTAQLRNSYISAETARSTASDLEYILYPNTMTLLEAMAMISPQRV